MIKNPADAPIPMSTNSACQPVDVIDWFRTASPYINAHRGKTLVLALPGQWFHSDLLPTLTSDLTLLSHLGLRLVVCFGLRAQVDKVLARDSLPSEIVSGRRVTDEHALKTIIEAAGIARHSLESQFSMGLPNTPMAGSRLSISSGNFVAAQPFGIHDGVDFLHTGSVREVHVKAINTLLDDGHLVMLPPLGYSVTGDVFNIPVYELATSVATALGADKLVFLVNNLPSDEAGELIRQASAHRLKQLHDSLKTSSTPEGPTALTSDANLTTIIPFALSACRAGVDRVHLLRSDDRNALLAELYTRDGSGTMVTAGRWENIRPATVQDVRGIIELIEPLQTNGTLINRSREQLELDIERFVVSERDGMVVACAAMYPDNASSSVEIACIATHPQYQGEGRANQLLSHLESVAVEHGFRWARVLSTRAGHWFVERGYKETASTELPPSRRASYNLQRNSKIYTKALH